MPRGSTAPHLRLQAIEMLLLWEGQVSRARLLDLFPIHPTLASRDIAAFRQQFPNACHPHGGGRRFVADEGLVPALTQGEFAEYQQLVGLAGSALASLPGVALERVQPDRTQIAARVFARLHTAIRDGNALQIQYRSMATPVLHARVIRPHTFIQAGPRWHVRSYCHEAKDFRDFNLGRISAAALVPETVLPGPDEDVAWHRQVRLRVVPHRDLNSAQAAMVRDEFMRGTAALAFDLREPLARYLVLALGAAVDPAVETPPRHLLMVQSPEALPAGLLFGAPSAP